jgi:ribose 5-phosphate isomerase B
MLYIAADHRGFDEKEKLKHFFDLSNIEFEDIGAKEYDPDDDYPDFAFMLGELVVKENAKGIILCGSGIGVCVACNKVKGVRAGYAESIEHAIKAREDDDTNILVLDDMTFEEDEDFPIITAWLNTDFSGEKRHIRRLKKISDYEDNWKNL